MDFSSFELPIPPGRSRLPLSRRRLYTSPMTRRFRWLDLRRSLPLSPVGKRDPRATDASWRRARRARRGRRTRLSRRARARVRSSAKHDRSQDLPSRPSRRDREPRRAPAHAQRQVGAFQISGDDKAVTIDKLQLAGEGVSDSSQRCVVDIVGETPIEATNVGRPDGLERFEAKVPACPISFDVLDGAVLVPPKSPPACSRPPTARPRPAASGARTAPRWSAMRPRS